MSPDPSIVAKVCRDEVLPYLGRKYGAEPMRADVAVR
jgi:ribonuclease HII